MSIELIVSSLWLALVAWLILRALGQRHALRRLPTAASAAGGAGTEAPTVALIIPARNESLNIGPCVRALLQQQYPAGRLRLIVVDDESSDDTAQIVARLAAGDGRLTLLATPPLPRGWKGKVHASAVGAAAAAECEWLCFIDADMRAEPPLLASAVGSARAGGLDLLSLAPRHELASFAERLIIPCGLYLLGFAQDLKRIQAPESGEAVATGQFMLVRRAAYEAVGGFAAVRSEICEDVALARLLKRRGHRVLLEDGSELLATRMYTGWGTLWPGIAKNLIEMLGGAGRTLATVLIAVTLAWAAVVVPGLDVLACMRGASGAGAALALALLASAAAFGLHLAGAVHFRIPVLYGLLFPFGYTVGAVIALDSVRWRLTGRVHWKGRVYS